MIVLIIFSAVSLFFLGRSFLILFGLYKDPILRTFEDYGPEERMYLPGLPLMVWTGVTLFLAGLWITPYSGFVYTLNGLSFGILVLSGFAYNYYERATKYHFMILKLPRWYHELREQTTRYERRRIAYMWLHLPARSRLAYNSSDKLFFQWADFVIMATIREEGGTVQEDGFYYKGRQG